MQTCLRLYLFVVQFLYDMTFGPFGETEVKTKYPPNLKQTNKQRKPLHKGEEQDMFYY